MALVDWLVVAGYMLFTIVLGVLLSRRASKSMEDFFVSGRSLPWWLAGTSMAATTFSIDTPLYVAGVVGSRGISGNWEWWAFGFGHVLLIYLFARLWRRSEVVTDAQLIEMRYGGKLASALRGIKAFLFAVPINCIGVGYIMLAAVKVIGTLGIWEALGMDAGQEVLGMDPKLLLVIGLSVFVLIYTGFSGLWGVVVTDFFQFFLALFGAILVAYFAIRSPEIGGLRNLSELAQANTSFDVLAFVPVSFTGEGMLGIAWSAFAGISATTFAAYVFLQWWTFSGNSPLPRKISVHGGYKIPLRTAYKKGETAGGRERSISPTFNFRKQGRFDQLDIGTYFTFSPMIFGIWYRGIPIQKSEAGGLNSEAIIGMIGVMQKRFTLGYSFDYTISNLGIGSGGAHELSLTYTFKWGDPRKPSRDIRELRCPVPYIF
ncbi:MAG: type IX secretion system membrane protein PorP/SprF [Bacteroidota bacterium]